LFELRRGQVSCRMSWRFFCLFIVSVVIAVLLVETGHKNGSFRGLLQSCRETSRTSPRSQDPGLVSGRSQPRLKPARVFVLSMPKTAAGSISKAVSQWYRDGGDASQGKMFVCHYPYHETCGAMQHLTCTPDSWCLIVSGVRMLGPELMSLFFQNACGGRHAENSTPCLQLRNWSDEVVADNFMHYCRSIHYGEKGMHASWWSRTKLSFHRAGLQFSLNDLIRDGVSELPNAVWVLLPLEKGNRFREERLHQWLPGVNLSTDEPHNRAVYADLHARMMTKCQSSSFWAEDVRISLMHSDTMTFFYNATLPC